MSPDEPAAAWPLHLTPHGRWRGRAGKAACGSLSSCDFFLAAQRHFPGTVGASSVGFFAIPCWRRSGEANLANALASKGQSLAPGPRLKNMGRLGYTRMKPPGTSHTRLKNRITIMPIAIVTEPKQDSTLFHSLVRVMDHLEGSGHETVKPANRREMLTRAVLLACQDQQLSHSLEAIHHAVDQQLTVAPEENAAAPFSFGWRRPNSLAALNRKRKNLASRWRHYLHSCIVSHPTRRARARRVLGFFVEIIRPCRPLDA
jgi:hypothetical protein